MFGTGQRSHWPHQQQQYGLPMEVRQQEFTYQSHTPIPYGGPPRLSVNTNANTNNSSYLQSLYSQQLPIGLPTPQFDNQNGVKYHALPYQPEPENTVSQDLHFQDEVANTMMSTSASQLSPRRPSIEAQHHFQAQQPQIMQSYDSRRGSDFGFGFDNSAPVQQQQQQPWGQQTIWGANGVSSPAKEARPMPIPNALAYRPSFSNSHFGSYAASNGTSPMTPASPCGVKTELGDNFESYYRGARTQQQYSHPEKIDQSHWTNARADNIPMPMPMQYPQPQLQAQSYPPTFPTNYQEAIVSSQPEERFETPELDDYASSVDAHSGAGWPPPRSRRASGQLEKDTTLVECRRLGMSYKEIKRMYSFTEAESTLRGRYRTLTKEKKDRVRRPEWTDRDVSTTFAPLKDSADMLTSATCSSTQSSISAPRPKNCARKTTSPSPSSHGKRSPSGLSSTRAPMVLATPRARRSTLSS